MLRPSRAARKEFSLNFAAGEPAPCAGAPSFALLAEGGLLLFGSAAARLADSGAAGARRRFAWHRLSACMRCLRKGTARVPHPLRFLQRVGNAFVGALLACPEVYPPWRERRAAPVARSAKRILAQLCRREPAPCGSRSVPRTVIPRPPLLLKRRTEGSAVSFVFDCSSLATRHCFWVVIPVLYRRLCHAPLAPTLTLSSRTHSWFSRMV